MKALLGVIGIIIILLLFGTFMGGIKDAQTDERTDTFAAVVTGGGVTTADVELVTDIYDNNILEVTEITSDLGTDSPLPDTYVSATNTLTVRGLTAAQTRTLTVTYRYDSLAGTDAEPTGKFLGFLPIMVIIVCICIAVAGVILAFKH